MLVAMEYVGEECASAHNHSCSPMITLKSPHAKALSPTCPKLSSPHTFERSAKSNPDYPVIPPAPNVRAPTLRNRNHAQVSACKGVEPHLSNAEQANPLSK